jgi:hypothetical protein
MACSVSVLLRGHPEDGSPPRVPGRAGGFSLRSTPENSEAVFDGEVTVHDSRCAGHSDAAAQRGKDARKFISPLANERTALRRLRRQCQGTNAAGLTFLECVAGATSRQMLDCRCAAYFDVYQTRTTAAQAALAHGSRTILWRGDWSGRL